jgi:protease IV
MAEETEIVLDRRRLRRSLTMWRALGLGALALAVGAMVLGSDTLSSLARPHHIARVSIEGTITESRDQLRMFDKIAKDDRVAALLVFVNSPGGTTTGGEAIYEALRTISKTKPVVAQFGTVAASAGYIVGMGADHIVARGNTITGSIGVIAQWPEVGALLDKLGVKMNEVKSGSLKAQPSMFAPMDEPSRQVTQNMVNDGFSWFLSLVEQRRGVKTAAVPGLEQGRIFSGREALVQKLVDEIGGEVEAVRWLESSRGVAANLKVVDWKPRHDDVWGVPRAAASLSGQFAGEVVGEGAAHMVRALRRDTRFEALSLDGLMSVWQPAEK